MSKKPKENPREANAARQAALPLHEWRPVPLTSFEVAFAADVRGMLPPWDQIPAEFKKSDRPSNKLAAKLFTMGTAGVFWRPRQGIGVGAATRHIAYCLLSFEPAQEHKTAGIAYLLELWFEGVDDTKFEPVAATS